MNAQQEEHEAAQEAEREAPASTVRYDHKTGWIEFLRMDAPYETLEIMWRYEILLHAEYQEVIGVRIRMPLEELLTFLSLFDLENGQALPIRWILEFWHSHIIDDPTPEERLLKKFYYLGERALGDAALAPDEWQRVLRAEAA